jgi:hypothetical protein
MNSSFVFQVLKSSPAAADPSPASIYFTKGYKKDDKSICKGFREWLI